jgi:energy-coupling factor transporter ATP-binding protein EcfA2
MQITSGIVEGAQKVVIHGPEGIGKSSLAAMFPKGLFIDTEGSTKKLNVRRMPKPSSWMMLMSHIDYIKRNPHECDTLIIDTIDWAEDLCISNTCSSRGKEGVEDFGYGKGYVYLEEDFGRLLNALTDLVEINNINTVLLAHSLPKKFDLPDEMGSYDRYELKLEKKTAPLVKEWADMILFINYKTFVVNSQSDGKGKNKAQGSKRVIYTQHHATAGAWSNEI